MGLDGGSIPHRSEMVKVKKKDPKAGKQAKRRHRFFTCALTGAPLSPPIAACRTGRLYNKEAVLTALLSKRAMPKELAHLQSVSDVVTVQFKTNPSYEKSAAAGVIQPTDDVSPWVCPVTGKGIGMSPERFLLNWRCGCVVSHDLLLHAPAPTACYSCGREASEEDLVELIAEDEATAELQLRLLEAKEAARAARREKKKLKKKSKQETGGDERSRKRVKGADAVPTGSKNTVVAQAAARAEAKTARVASLFANDAEQKKLANSDLFMRVSKSADKL